MQPTLNPFYPSSKDILLVKKPTGPVINEIQKNSIITFKIADRDFIKRITGLPGDLVSFKADQNSDFEVPEGNLWLLGDNQGASMDSTRLGPICMSRVSGVVKRIVWPPSRFFCSLDYPWQ